MVHIFFMKAVIRLSNLTKEVIQMLVIDGSTISMKNKNLNSLSTLSGIKITGKLSNSTTLYYTTTMSTLSLKKTSMSFRPLQISGLDSMTSSCCMPESAKNLIMQFWHLSQQHGPLLWRFKLCCSQNFLSLFSFKATFSTLPTVIPSWHQLQMITKTKIKFKVVTTILKEAMQFKMNRINMTMI